MAKCKDCGYNLTAHSMVVDPRAIPRKGDISICFGCGVIRMFSDNDEIIDLPENFEKLYPNAYAEAVYVSNEIKNIKKIIKP